MILSTDLVRTLAEIAETGSLDAAARRLEITPSAVSQRLKSLETLLGRVVLVRSKPVRLTTAGDSVVRFARQAQQLEDEVLRNLGVVSRGIRPRISVRVDTDLRSYWVAAVASAAADIPVDISMFEEGVWDDGRESGQAAIAVTVRPEEAPGWETISLGSVGFDAVASPAFVERWGLLRAGSLSFSNDAPTVIVRGRERRHNTFLTADTHTVSDSITTVPSTEIALAFAEAGHGWCLLPRTVTTTSLQRGRLLRVSTTSIREDYQLQRWGIHTPAVEAVISRLQQTADTLFTSDIGGIERGGLSDATA
ncbi:LysR family transcriptional regulator [Agromyces albus]|nr:LysR family transcriptional regulator [Agromyces albus]